MGWIWRRIGLVAAPALVAAVALGAPPPEPAAAAATPSCVIRGPQWTQHIPAMGAAYPAQVLKGRLYVVMPPQYGCAKARQTLARIFPLIPPHAKAHAVLRGGPPGWVCYSSGSGGPTDITYAGLCQSSRHAFLEWGPYRAPTR